MENVFIEAASNHLNEVKQYMTHLEMTDENHKSLLHYAVAGSAHDVIRYLLDLNISVNMIDQYGETPLFDCARKAKINIAKLLISKYAQVNIENRRQESPIHLASFKGNLDMIKLLVESGAFLNKETQDGLLPIHYAIAGGQTHAIEYLLKISHQSYHLKDSHGQSLLHHATKTSNVEMIKKLLESGLDVNGLNDVFETPIFNAVRFSTLESVKLLLSFDALLDVKNRRFETPLDIAKIFNKYDMIDFLSEYLETPTYQNLVKNQLLTIAVLNRDHIYLRKLVEQQHRLKKDRYNKTALDYAKTYRLNLCVNILRDLEV